MSFLEALKSVFLQILYQSWVPSNITPLYFLSWNIVYFGQKQPIKVQIFEIFGCSGQNLLNSLCQFSTNKLVPFQILHHFLLFITHNSPVNLKLIYIFFLIKGPHKSSNFRTFKCSGENLPNSSCHFPNQKSVFLQILPL